MAIVGREVDIHLVPSWAEGGELVRLLQLTLAPNKARSPGSLRPIFKITVAFSLSTMTKAHPADPRTAGGFINTSMD